MFSMVTVIMGVFGLISYNQSRDMWYETLNNQGNQIARRLALSLVDPLWNFNSLGVETLTVLELENENIFAIIIDDQSEIVGKIKTGSNELVDFKGTEQQKQEIESNYSKFEERIIKETEDIGEIGTVTVYTTEKNIRSILRCEAFKQLFQLIILDILLIISVVSAFFILVRRPLKKIGLNFQDIAEGDSDLTQTILFKNKDEVGELAFWFNMFVQKLRGIITNVKEVSIKNLSIKENLGTKTQESVSALNEISTNIDNIKEQFRTLDQRISQSIEVLDNTNKRLTDLDKSVNEELSAVENYSASINEMIASLKNVASITKKRLEGISGLNQITASGGAKLDEMISFVEKVHSNIGNIFEMVSIIDGISSQTNLLAMNAAIEAAQAGESGKGFSVVADEIRKLSENYSNSSSAISKMLNSMVSDIKHASDESIQTKKSFGDINDAIHVIPDSFSEISASNDELSVGSNEIDKTMKVLHDITNNLGDSTVNLKTNSKDLNDSMGQVQRISVEVSTGMEEISQGADLISGIVNELYDLAEELDKTSNSIDR